MKPLNQWALNGKWTVGSEDAQPKVASGTIVFRFHARDVHLVPGPGRTASQFDSRSNQMGASPEMITAATSTQTEQVRARNQLYQLIRQKGTVEDRTFEIEFLDSGAQVFAFPFG